MQYEIEVAGRRRRIVVARTGDCFAVTVDGRTRHVDVARIDAHTLSLIVDTVMPIDVSITAAAGGQMTVHVAGAAVPVVVNDHRRYGRQDSGSAAAGPQRLAAPMPGKIVRVPVAVGESVRVRQPLVVVEAMKMENELRASRDGTVAEVHVREGMSVEAGALLIVIQ
jgi:biotin carboxyl carrier protein